MPKLAAERNGEQPHRHDLDLARHADAQRARELGHEEDVDVQSPDQRTGEHDRDIRCEAIDCPVLYARLRYERQGHYARQQQAAAVRALQW